MVSVLCFKTVYGSYTEGFSLTKMLLHAVEKTGMKEKNFLAREVMFFSPFSLYLAIRYTESECGVFADKRHKFWTGTQN